MNPQTITEYIDSLERRGIIDKECKFCLRVYYPELKEGKLIQNIFAPRHNGSPRCKSGKSNHCTCDACF